MIVIWLTIDWYLWSKIFFILNDTTIIILFSTILFMNGFKDVIYCAFNIFYTNGVRMTNKDVLKIFQFGKLDHY